MYLLKQTRCGKEKGHIDTAGEGLVGISVIVDTWSLATHKKRNLASD